MTTARTNGVLAADLERRWFLLVVCLPHTSLVTSPVSSYEDSTPSSRMFFKVPNIF